MQRTLFEQEHEDFRQVVRDFIAKQVVPHYDEWTTAGIVPRDLYLQLGAIGAMGFGFPATYGGGGVDDYRYNVVLQEESARANVTLGTLRTHLDVVVPYMLKYANDEQRDQWFPGLASGELLLAIAMTEPGTGSDLAGVKTTAKRDGDDYILNGAKTFITGGEHADLVIVLARTSEPVDGNRRTGLSLIIVESGTPGFTKGRRLPKIGIKVQDTVELSFEDVRVPADNVLGEVDHGFSYLGHNLAQERLAIAVGSVAQSRAAMEMTIDYVKNRNVFGTTVAAMQNTKFEIAAVAAEIEAAQAMCDLGIRQLIEGQLSGADAAKVKLFCTEMQARTVDRCLQLHGGYGYILEYPIARLYSDARVSRIYGGTSEVMKSIISKSLGL
ncbi:acyl-CoA dehydrogenase family protein [Mycobacterium sp. CVI_P3]|uniref:Acyl-[acyl-carrier-protein] dehydrogenase MbtN n=1 Tax=Mycobacterium pinniadriaticum TaxID=2994102 RepID=A0ABT3SPQ3_9MYCO|nr:acyl-CoA dehydrogenase family protein [Mycobacterium pinniadriaticum]MCX2934432.1 acyl-CoA dehydrogenase family protein [Mycobacterium pinniadriaticum]MCX2940855.1 acyl-CoA dehydrogenase family protein [Mycobacterium pinniadriaticum]